MNKQLPEQGEALLAAATGVCAQWEELAGRQMQALAAHDLPALAGIQAEQAALLGQMSALAAQGQQMAVGRGAEAAGPAGAAGGAGTDGDVRQAFLRQAQRVYAANYRNARALAALAHLGRALAPLVPALRAPTYARSGALSAPPSGGWLAVDRQG